MKHFHGRRHIRARNSVKAGRLHRQIHKLERRVNNLKTVNNTSFPHISYTEEFVKAWSALTKPFQSVTENVDGTYTYEWNFTGKWKEHNEPTL